MRVLLAFALLAVTASPLHAQEFKRNAWGVLFAPMHYGLTEGTRFETYVYNTAMDVGLFYSRAVTPGISARIEAIGHNRHVNTFVSEDSGGDPSLLYSLDETGFTTTLLVFGDNRFDLSGHAARFSFGGGLMVSAVTDQQYGAAVPVVTPFPEVSEYGTVGFLLDAGMYLQIKRTSSIFTRFRYQQDASTFDVSDTETARKYTAFGFLVGAEFSF